MKTILIPTDFSIESLHTVRGALEQQRDESINLILAYGMYLSDSITDLLFFSKPRLLSELQSEKFTEACEILENKYDSQIHTLTVDLFVGTTQGAFNNFLEGNAVDELFIPRTYRFRPGKRGFDLTPYLRRSSIPLTEIEWREASYAPEKDRLSELFLLSDQLQFLP